MKQKKIGREFLCFFLKHAAKTQFFSKFQENKQKKEMHQHVLMHLLDIGIVLPCGDTTLFSLCLFSGRSLSLNLLSSGCLSSLSLGSSLA